MIQQNLDEVTTAITYATWEDKQEILRKYVESVIDECAVQAQGIQDIEEGITAVKSQL